MLVYHNIKERIVLTSLLRTMVKESINKSFVFEIQDFIFILVIIT